ncbi:MAG: dienelactone hydrolase family protein [Saprospiraceae bacterium]|nr:dienelactone hydrolase family protein [Saprospiraceae bacterium]
MRLSTVSFFLIVVSVQVMDAQSISCCKMSSVQEFATLGKDLSFVMMHEEPLPFTLFNPKGKTIHFSVESGPVGQGYYIAGKKDVYKWIFVIQEWWGLNDFIRNEADKLHEKTFPDYHILALDMYDGKVAATREEAASLMQEAKPERLENIIKGASILTGEKAKIATIGWCFGGAWSNKCAVLLGEKSSACVMYYGMPIKDEAQLTLIGAPVLGIFADKDGWITPAIVAEFKSKMEKLGKSIVVYGYDADHAFANPSNPKFNKVFAEDAWVKTIAFLKKYL